jgi:sentrin-specific protease 7
LSLISPSSWLQKALARHEQPKTNHRATLEPEETPAVTNLRQSEPATSAQPAGSGISRSTRTRDRYIDRLESSHTIPPLKPGGQLSGTTTIITGKDRAASAAGDSIPNEDDPSTDPKKGISSMLKGNVSRYFTPRATRSSTTNSAAPNHLDADTAQPKLKFSQTGELGTPWKKPLVYPKTGKKRETVDFQDLERLDDDEFLNDNLIGFYLGYLEHYLEKEKPEVAKKVYFFNSYFFARLTQTQKGIKGINYAAVQKWTRTVDIFSRDFVVVPVNENLHWYVAIICNLPNLRRQLADDDDDRGEVESIATSETVPAAKGDGNGEGEITEEQAEEPDGETRSSFAGLSLRDEGKSPLADGGRPPIITSDAKPQSSPKSKKGPGRRKFARRSLTKIDPNKPVVITLDSLGLSRTVTRTALKDYIIAEGKSKRNLDLERGDLEGVTAKGIPAQKNYSDCGLFLCAYMERFVMDPYRFVHDILQRDMNEAKDWPMMSSNELRSRLRNVIMELHRRQEGEKELVPIPDVGRILLCRPSTPPLRPVSEPDLQEVPPDARNALVDLADEEAASQVTAELTAAADVVATQPPSSPELSQGAALKSAEDAVNRPSPEGNSNIAVRWTPDTAIVIPDSPDLPAPRHMSSRFRSHVNANNNLIDGLEEFDDNPQALAERLRRDRSPTKAQGQARSQSVSTDFMSGLQSYAREPSPGEMPGGWDDGEVPETQSQEKAAGDTHEEEDDLPQEILKGI